MDLAFSGVLLIAVKIVISQFFLLITDINMTTED